VRLARGMGLATQRAADAALEALGAARDAPSF